VHCIIRDLLQTYGTYRYAIMASGSSQKRKSCTLKLKLEAGKPGGSNRSWVSQARSLTVLS